MDIENLCCPPPPYLYGGEEWVRSLFAPGLPGAK